MGFGIAIKFSKSLERASISASANYRYGPASGAAVLSVDSVRIDHLTLRAGEPSAVVHGASRWISQRVDLQ